MCMRRVLWLAWLWSLCLPVVASAQPTPDPFAPDDLPELRLYMHSADLITLRERYEANTYYPADLEFRGTRVRNVGLRSRGSGSRSATKLGLRIDLDRYTSGQQFAGARAFVLDNLWQDPTNVREVLAMQLFAAAGLPTPREIFVRVFVNDAYEGLYALVEEIDEQFAARALGDGAGTLFEYNWLDPWYGDDLGDDLTPYQDRFDAQTNDGLPTATLHGPLRELFRSSDESPEDWRARVGALLDLEALMRYVAVEAFTSELDGWLGYAGMNNFYLFRGSGGPAHRPVPWDRDNAFFDVESSIWQRADENVLVRRALAFPDLRAVFLDTLEAVATQSLADGWLAGELDRLLALVDAAAAEDVRKPFPEEERAQAVAQLREFVAARPARVLADVARARGGDQ